MNRRKIVDTLCREETALDTVSRLGITDLEFFQAVPVIGDLIEKGLGHFQNRDGCTVPLVSRGLLKNHAVIHHQIHGVAAVQDHLIQDIKDLGELLLIP